MPTPIIQGMLLKISDLYEQRENDVFGLSHVNLKTYEALLMPYKLWPETSDENEIWNA